MAGQIKVDSINADSNLALKIANTTVAFIDSSGLRPTSGNVNLDATATSKLYLPSANTVAIQTAGVTAVTVDSSQNTTLAGTASATKLIPTGSSVTGNGMYLPAANALGLSTNGTNAVYIDSSQNVGIGTASPGNKLTVVSTGNIAAQITGKSTAAAFSSSTFWDGTGGGLQITNSEATTNAPTSIRFIQTGSPDAAAGIAAVFSSSSASNLVFCTNNGGVTTPERMRIDSSGGLILAGSTAQKATGTTWSNPSDRRLKDNICDYANGMTELMQLRVREWEYNGKGGTTKGMKGLGVIADEVMTVLPATVENYNAKLNVDDEETTDIKRFDATEITWLLVKTVQELKAIVDAQAVRIAALEA